MKASSSLLALFAFALGSASPVPSSPSAVGWTTGAVGTLGEVVYGPGQHVIDLATTGLYDPTRWVVILDYNSLTVESGATITFANHPSRAPVVVRAVGPISIQGALLLDGADGHAAGALPTHSEPGPGGFRGGLGRGDTSLVAHSPGHGPGGGLVEASAGPAFEGGSASHGTVGTQTDASAAPGPRYGSPVALPLVGGSGGGGANFVGGAGGGAGGGAILIGSDLSVDLSGLISVRGGGQGGSTSGPGSGGTIRVASPDITWSGGGVHLDARGGSGAEGLAGRGRVRLESDGEPTGLITTPPASVAELSEFLPPAPPTVRLSAWWHEPSQSWIPIDPDPRAELEDGNLADVVFPATGTQTLRVEGVNVALDAQLHVRTTYVGGVATPPVIDSSHTVGEVEGSTLALSWTDVAIDFSLGVGSVQVRAELP